ncbi:phage protein [Staphylococcus aureus]|nr:hypothetical protein O473_02735 [Staphylococcus aureus M0359]EVH76072.1 hypothetical protein T946_02607 [Staphylococcus aureus SCLE6029]CAC9162104.1 phage protein [Staphylococcus aureus]CAI3034971.1 hypothetical protein KFBCBFFP_KFBCBFFP_00726 [Staphylococcus aureus]CFF21178.1 phage protein [Staphylococcus aureus]
MPIITSYITQDDGTTTVVISGVELGNKETLLLDNGFDVEVDVKRHRSVSNYRQATTKNIRACQRHRRIYRSTNGLYATYVHRVCKDLLRL